MVNGVRSEAPIPRVRPPEIIIIDRGLYAGVCFFFAPVLLLKFYLLALQSAHYALRPRVPRRPSDSREPKVGPLDLDIIFRVSRDVRAPVVGDDPRFKGPLGQLVNPFDRDCVRDDGHDLKPRDRRIEAPGNNFPGIPIEHEE